MADKITNDNNFIVKFDTGKHSFPIANGVTLGIGALVQLESGYLNHWDEAGLFLGVVVSGEDEGRGTLASGTLLGDTSRTPDPEGYVDTSGVILTNLAALGGTPTQAKVGDQVWAADSDQASLTLTATAFAAIGRLWRFNSSTKCDVKLFPVSKSASLAGIIGLTNSSGGTGVDTIVAVAAMTAFTDSTGATADGDIIADGFTQGAALTDSTTGSATTTLAAGAGTYLLSIPIALAGVTGAADVVTDYIIGHKFKVLSMRWITTTVASTAGDNLTFTADIGATPITSLTITLDSDTSSTTTLGGVLTVDATAANTGSASATLSLVAGTVAAFVEGSGVVQFEIQNMDTADAFASLAAERDLARTDVNTANENFSIVSDKIAEMVTWQASIQDNQSSLADKINEILATQ